MIFTGEQLREIAELLPKTNEKGNVFEYLWDKGSDMEVLRFKWSTDINDWLIDI